VASFVLISPSVEVDGEELASVCEQLEINDEIDEVEFTNFGSAGHREYKGGLKSGTMTLTLHQDYATDLTNDVIGANYGEIVPVVVIPDSGASVSATNPSYTADYLITSYPFLSGAVGDKTVVSVSMRRTGPFTISTT
jgi:hypothetical protein